MATASRMRGYGSKDRPLAEEQWSQEAHKPDTPALTARGNYEPDYRHYDLARYHDPERARLELEHVWSGNWLMACREEDIPEVGDRVPLQVGPKSYFIVRSAPDEFKAFYNSCPHRGTMLCTRHESAATIRCPFHGWEWNVDGRLKGVPSHWDFPDITRQNGSLPEVRIERWGGFIFINTNREAPSLIDALQVIPEHFAEFQPEHRYTAARFRKLVRANWKIAQEAFMEAYHLYATHPEAVPISADCQTLYDIWRSEDGHVARNASCGGTPSMHAPAEHNVFTAAEAFGMALRDWHYPGEDAPVLDRNKDSRAQLGDWHREVASRFYGRRIDLADAIMMDSIVYYAYPNLAIWLSESVPFTFQFLPHETDPEKSWFDVRLLLPAPEGQAAPPSAAPVVLDEQQSVFENCPGFGFLGFVFDQDMTNMPLIQKGARAADPDRAHTHLGTYQESIIQYWNQVMDDQIARGEAAKLG